MNKSKLERKVIDKSQRGYQCVIIYYSINKKIANGSMTVLILFSALNTLI